MVGNKQEIRDGSNMWKMARYLPIVIGSLAILSTVDAFAHPHVWVDSRSKLVFDDQNRISAVSHAWQFDVAFSAFAVHGLDENGDGKFSRQELQPLAEVNVTSLVDFDYFTYLSFGDSAVAFATPVDYHLEFADGQLTLHYVLPLEEPILMDGQDAKLQVYDPAYFVAIEVPESNPFEFVNGGETCEMTIERPKQLEFNTVSLLAAIPATEREIPQSLMQITSTLSNTAQISCS